MGNEFPFHSQLIRWIFVWWFSDIFNQVVEGDTF